MYAGASTRSRQKRAAAAKQGQKEVSSGPTSAPLPHRANPDNTIPFEQHQDKARRKNRRSPRRTGAADVLGVGSTGAPSLSGGEGVLSIEDLDEDLLTREDAQTLDNLLDPHQGQPQLPDAQRQPKQELTGRQGGAQAPGRLTAMWGDPPFAVVQDHRAEPDSSKATAMQKLSVLPCGVANPDKYPLTHYTQHGGDKVFLRQQVTLSGPPPPHTGSKHFVVEATLCMYTGRTQTPGGDYIYSGQPLTVSELCAAKGALSNFNRCGHQTMDQQGCLFELEYDGIGNYTGDFVFRWKPVTSKKKGRGGKKEYYKLCIRYRLYYKGQEHGDFILEVYSWPWTTRSRLRVKDGEGSSQARLQDEAEKREDLNRHKASKKRPICEISDPESPSVVRQVRQMSDEDLEKRTQQILDSYILHEKELARRRRLVGPEGGEIPFATTDTAGEEI